MFNYILYIGTSILVTVALGLFIILLFIIVHPILVREKYVPINKLSYFSILATYKALRKVKLRVFSRRNDRLPIVYWL